METRKSITIKKPNLKSASFVSDHIKDDSFIKLNKIYSNNIWLDIHIKNNNLSDLLNDENSSLLWLHYFKGEISNEDIFSKGKPYSISLNPNILEYDVKYLPKDTWPLSLDAGAIDPCDYIVFGSPIVGLEFEVICHVKT